MLVIEMNPRVSRSSALASKATGFPIARIGTKLAVGYRLDEIPNDITRTTPASFEPVLDYVVIKCPRFAFEKFRAANPGLTTQMKSVGESMAIGRTFKEAFQKALRALEIGRPGWTVGETLADDRLDDDSVETLRAALRQPTPERIFQVKRALAAGVSIDEIYQLTRIDRWFLSQLLELLDVHGAFVTIDAMGCQKAIAQKIVDGGGDYVLSVKDNQPHLLEDIQETLGKALDCGREGMHYQTYTTQDRGHGRQEMRSYVIVTDLDDIRNRQALGTSQPATVEIQDRLTGS